MELCECASTIISYKGICTSCGGVCDFEARIRELEHQHKNDEAANMLLNEVCEMQRKRIEELERK